MLRPIKKIQKYFMAYQYLSEIFHDPCKNFPVPPPTYLMYGLCYIILNFNMVSIF